jgi:putative pyruvate formate lyase activating enzyme
VDRRKKNGFCKAGILPTVAKVMLHRWEEPCICYGLGSGAIFFSSCQLQCIFCQNHEISCHKTGKEMKREELSDLFFLLEEKGACNINLVSPTPHLGEVIPALELAKSRGLTLPIVFNSGGYEAEESIRNLDGLVDIYMPDFKFFDSVLSSSYAAAADYAQTASRAIKLMQKQTGKPTWNGDRLVKGTLVRHLVLPGHVKDTLEIIKHLSEQFENDAIILSLMRQYTPMHKAKEHPFLSRKITSLEYGKAVDLARNLGFQFLYTQQKESASEEYVPDFNSDTLIILDK